MRELLREGRFRLLLAGQTASMFGDSVMLLVLAIWVKDLTGSSGLAGTVILMVVAPSLLSPLLGWAVDRVPRRPFLIWANVGSAAALLPLFAVRDRGEVWIVYAVAALYGLSFTLLAAALAGLLKEIVVDQRLPDANGALRTVREGLRLVGPLAGAGLYALAGPGAVVVVDLVSFLAAAAAIAALRVPEEPPEAGDLAWLAEASAGFRHLVRQRALRRTVLASAATLLVFGTIESGIFAYVDDGLHRPATFVSVLITTMGVGSIAGGLLAAPVIRRIGEMGTAALGVLLIAAGLGPLGYPVAGLGLGVMPLVGAGVSFTVVAVTTLIQRRTPPTLMARVSTATDLVIGVPQTVSIAAGAILVSVIDYRWIFVTAALGLLAVAAGLWTGREPVAAPAAVPGPGAPAAAG